MKFVRIEKSRGWTMKAKDRPRVIQADEAIRQLTGFNNLLTGGGPTIVLGLDVAEKLIEIAKSQNLSQIKCVICDKPFTAKRADARFCSPACRKKSSRNGAHHPVIALNG